MYLTASDQQLTTMLRNKIPFEGNEGVYILKKIASKSLKDCNEAEKQIHLAFSGSL